MTNLGAETITVLLPCRMHFIPVDDDTQRVMIIQSEEVIIEGGETVVIEPYVICIDGSAGASSGCLFSSFCSATRHLNR